MSTNNEARAQVTPLLITIEAACALTSVSRSVGYELAHTEWRSFTVKIGKSLRVLRSGLDEWIAAKYKEAQATSRRV